MLTMEGRAPASLCTMTASANGRLASQSSALQAVIPCICRPLTQLKRYMAEVGMIDSARQEEFVGKVVEQISGAMTTLLGAVGASPSA